MDGITGPETMRIPAEWPAPAPGQVEVMLLGSYHMDGGVDGDVEDVDDVLDPNRQGELRTLVDVLADWEPDLVAVERPHDRADRVNELYDEYREGTRAYAEFSEIDPPHPDRTALDTECRNEVVQIGFRLAERLGHDRVAAVDYPLADVRRDFDEPFERAVDEFHDRLERTTELPEKVGVPPIDEDYLDALAERLRSRTIPEHLVELNRAPAINAEQYHVFGHGLRMDTLVGPRRIMLWYGRNVRMCHYLWREMDETTGRICFVVGYGHVDILRHLLTAAPMFCPVSALPSMRMAAERLVAD